MKITNLILGIVFIGIIAFTGCKKKEGCIDQLATNYCDDCKTDDESCEYDGSAVFYYRKTAADSLQANNFLILNFYVNGEVGNVNSASWIAADYWTIAPSCDDENSITFNKNLGNVKTKSYSYSVKGYKYNETDSSITGEIVIWNGNIDFKANSCIGHELTW